MKMYLETICLDLEEEKEHECNWDDENNSITNFGDRRKTVCLLHKLAEGI